MYSGFIYCVTLTFLHLEIWCWEILIKERRFWIMTRCTSRNCKSWVFGKLANWLTSKVHLSTYVYENTIPQQSCHWMLTWPSLVKAHRLFNPAETCKRRHGSSSGDASGGAIFFQAFPVQIHQRVHLFLSVLINLRLYSKAFKID